MSGIAGFIQSNNRLNIEVMQSIASKMRQALYQSPNANSIWINAEVGLALGPQSIVSNSGRYTLVFNGQIYNYPEIRQELINNTGAHSLQEYSDIEILLTAIETWGIERTLTYCIGTFACVLWDSENRKLYLVRDRMGEQPLYYGWMGDVFLFSSELKALRAHPKFKAEINRDALALYLRYGYIPTPYTIYLHINKLEPGSIFSIDCSNNDYKEVNAPFWSQQEIVNLGRENLFTGTEQEAVQELERLMTEIINRQMFASNVQAGAFLSGGIDSSTIVALMQSQSAQPIKTFSIGFNESEYNEANYAKQVAYYLGTDHTELYITSEQAMSVIPNLPILYDEPFADPSQIPTYLVAQLARQDVKLTLSGDGADELFGGYSRYFVSQSIWDKISWLPLPIRKSIATVLQTVPVGRWDQFSALMPAKLRKKLSGDRFHKLADIITVANEKVLYHYLISYSKDPSSVVLLANERETIITQPKRWVEQLDFFQWMMYIDMHLYLQDDILVKVGRASLGVDLQTRIPFLDHRLVEFAWQLPHSMKVKNNQGKWILRQLLHKYVPANLVERPKRGFGIPLNEWLRNPLKDWAEELLNEDRLKVEGFFRPEIISQKWKEHQSGKGNWAGVLWNVLMFQAWLEQWNTK